MSSEASLRIFISYSRTDEAFARQLAARLEQDGAEIWLDVDDIPAGANWSNAIQEGLRLCQVMILIFSPESLASPNVETEWQDFFDNRKPIIPVVLRPVLEEDIHFQIRRRQRVDFSQQRFDAAYQQLVSQLKPFSTQSTPAHNAAQPATPSTAPPPRIGLTRGRIAAILSVIAIVVIGGLLLANRLLPPSATPTDDPRVNAALTETFSAQTQVAAAITPSSTTAPTSTATATITPTAPDPNDLAAQIFATRTANAQETLDAYTDTPTITLTFTPDFQLSAEAIVAVTDTAIAVASFSKTPTVTATFMPFHTATPTFTLTSTPTFTWTPTATLTPTLDRGAERMINGIAYVYVPAGCFLMGSPESDQDAKENEKPQHNVCLTHAYWIGKYEVTNEEYQQFVDAGGYSNRDYWSEAGWAWKAGRTAPIIYPEQASDPKQPRVGITWYEAEAFAKWAGGRLPTEAEWEYAARGPQARLYPWGSQYRIGVANINESSVGGAYLDRSTDVGSYPGGVSWVGAHDMAGNVWEWCADSYDEHYYSQQIRDDPVGAESGDEHSLRGGSWISSPAGVRAAVRSRGLPDYQFRYNGMRIVVPVE